MAMGLKNDLPKNTEDRAYTTNSYFVDLSILAVWALLFQ